MTLPRKGSRTVVVDGTTYRWKLTPGRRSVLDAITTVHAHKDTQPAPSTLEVQVYRLHATTITPAMVANFIKGAIARGWQPTGSGTFRIGPDKTVEMFGGDP